MRFRILVALLLVFSLNRTVYTNDFVKVYEYRGIERSIKYHDFRDRFLDFYRSKMADCMNAKEFNREALYTCATHQMAWESRSKQDVIQLSMMELNGFYDSSEEFVLGDFDRKFIDKVRDVYKSWKQSMKAQVYHAF